MLKLTTDKHEASRGLSATAELFVKIRPDTSSPSSNVRPSLRHCPTMPYSAIVREVEK